MEPEDEIVFYQVDLEEASERVRRILRGRADLVLIFGSVARGQPARDLDVAIHTAREPGLDYILELGWELEQPLGMPADLAPIRALPPEARLQTLLEGFIVCSSSPGLLGDLVKEATAEISDMACKLACQSSCRAAGRAQPPPSAS